MPPRQTVHCPPWMLSRSGVLEILADESLWGPTTDLLIWKQNLGLTRNTIVQHGIPRYCEAEFCKWQSHFRVNSGFSVLQCWFTSCITMVTYAPQPTSRRGFCVREGRFIDLCLFDYYCFQPVGLIPAELHWLQLPICQNARLCLQTRSWTPWVELMSSMLGSMKQDKKKISDPCLNTHTDTFNVPVLYLVSLHPNE